MKKLISIITVLTISLMFIGCQSDSINPVKSNNSDLTLNKTNPIIQKATGSGHYFFAEDDWRTFSFTATMYDDGSVKGNYTRTHHFQGSSIHAKGIVTCISVDGNEVWIAGVDTQGDWTDYGTVFHAVDNGEGKNATDQISAQYVGLTPEEAILRCQSQSGVPLLPPLNDVESGNIQVH